MNVSKILKQTLFIAVLIGLTIFLVLLFYFTPENLTQVGSISLIKNAVDLQKKEPVPGLPVRIKIPVIDVNASIENVGLTPDGAVGVPYGPTNAAWFDIGARPGDLGSAIIVGHYGWKNGIQAVFDNLNALKKGDKIYIEDEKGMMLTFVVRELKTYGENENVSVVFGATDGKAHLNLITCKGVWNKALKSYSKRLVVFADRQ